MPAPLKCVRPEEQAGCLLLSNVSVRKSRQDACAPRRLFDVSQCAEPLPKLSLFRHVVDGVIGT